MSEEFGMSYAQMEQVSSEGMKLDVRVPKERFELMLTGVDFISVPEKRTLMDLLKDYVPEFQKYNPYAYALGYLAYKTDSVDSSPVVLSSKGVAVANQVMTNNINYLTGQPLDELIEVYDILRYARLYQRLYGMRIENEPIAPRETIVEDDNEEYGGFDDEYLGEDYSEYENFDGEAF